MPTVITDVVCPYCGCLCDDLEIVVEGNKILEVRSNCELGAEKFLHVNAPTRLKTPKIRVNGEFREVSVEEAVQKAAEILVNAKKPLSYGWSTTECEAIGLGIELAEEVGGIIDDTSSVCHGPTIIALQEIGISTCTLGEVKNRADLIIYWGCNPMQAHPRHLSRYTFFPRGFFRGKGQEERTLVVVDVRATETSRLAKQFIQVKPNCDYEVVSALRMAIKGHKLPYEVGGVPGEKIEEIASLMKKSKFIAIFFGLGMTMSGAKHRNVDNILLLVRDLHQFTKCVIMPMRGHYNVAGFNEVCTWQTGFPYAVDFSRGYPRYNPGETTAADLLARGDVDAALIVASDPVAHFPKDSTRHLMKIPVIAIDAYESLTTEIATVVIPAAIAGVEVEGTAYRMDHVPIRLRKVLNPPHGVLSDREIMARILEKVRELKGRTQ
ncbi:MAG: formylmethanofuran dehydrogenase subunit B [Nitrososphaerota archaeon]|nr:formylmethanofuran dehydrogenase subunit B [Nitrososphaerota archaeon]